MLFTENAANSSLGQTDDGGRSTVTVVAYAEPAMALIMLHKRSGLIAAQGINLWQNKRFYRCAESA
jgi:hypothetical protein